jgi:hypothetical protein
MAKLRFAESANQEYIVPRLDDDQIDDLFYQEDEIGEMRHTAFMIECGLEEDPPDGPDIPPVPWGDALKAQQSDSSADSKSFSSPSNSPYGNRRVMPLRTRSTDDMDLLEEEMSPKTKVSPKRRLVATKSGSLGRRTPPPRCNSSDNVGGTDLSLAFAKTNKASPKTAKRFVRSKSGTLHGMKAAAEAAMKNMEDSADSKPPIMPSRKLTKAKSGTTHGMGAAAAAARKLLEDMESAERDKPPKSPVRRLVASKSGTLHGTRKLESQNAADHSSASPRRVPVRKLVVAKSGTLHGMRKAAKDASSRPPRPGPSSSSCSDKLSSPIPEKRDVARVIYKNGKKTTIYKDSSPPTSPCKSADIPPLPVTRATPRTSSLSGSDSGSDDNFLKGIVSDDDDDASNISISTNGSENDSSPIHSPGRYNNGISSKSKIKVKKKKESSTSSPTKKSKERITPSKSSVKLKLTKLKNGSESPSSPTKMRAARAKMKAKSLGNLEIPPAFRNA